VLKRGNEMRKQLLEKCRKNRLNCASLEEARKAVEATITNFGECLISDEIKKAKMSSSEYMAEKAPFSMAGFGNKGSQEENRCHNAQKSNATLDGAQAAVDALHKPPQNENDKAELFSFLREKLLKDIFEEQEREIQRELKYMMHMRANAHAEAPDHSGQSSVNAREAEIVAQQRYFEDQARQFAVSTLTCPVCKSDELIIGGPGLIGCPKCPCRFTFSQIPNDPITKFREKLQATLNQHKRTGCPGNPSFAMQDSNLLCGCNTCKQIQNIVQ